VFSSNFADPTQAWPTSTDANLSLSVRGDQYLIQLKAPGRTIPVPNFGEVTPADLVNVGASATFQPTSTGPGDAIGVACRDIHGHAYVFGVGPGSSSGQLAWSITRKDAASERQLAGGTVPSPNQGPLNLEGDCSGGHTKAAGRPPPVALVLSLDGQVIGQANDTQILAPYFGAATVAVSSAHGSTSVTFSAFQIRAAPAS
jgi:hypothetical protein